MLELKRYHPFVITLFVFTLIAWDTIISHPLIHILLFIMSWIYILEFPNMKVKSILKQNIFLMILTAVSHPFFQHRGIYILCFIWNTPITWESILYGLDLGIMLAGIMNLFRIYSHMIYTDQILYMITKISCNAAILCSLSLRQLTSIKKQYEDIRYARSLMITKHNWFSSIRENIAVVSMLITWLMESGVETSLSMRSRGYGERKRSIYQRYPIEKRDRRVLLFNVVCIILSVIGMHGISFWWYPSFYQELSILQAALFFIACIGLCALPLCLFQKEVPAWEDIESI